MPLGPAKRGLQPTGRSPRPRRRSPRALHGGLTSKIHLVVDGRGLPLSVILTAGQDGDKPQLLPLLDAIAGPASASDARAAASITSPPLRLLPPLHARRAAVPAHRPLDPRASNQIAHRCSKGSRGGRPPAFTPERYAGRNLVEWCFNCLKQFRALATHYTKRAAYYRSTLLLASIVLWLRT